MNLVTLQSQKSKLQHAFMIKFSMSLVVCLSDDSQIQISLYAVRVLNLSSTD